MTVATAPEAAQPMADLLCGLPVPLADQIAAVAREIALRRRVYPKWIARRQISESRAAAELRAMEAVLTTLRSLI